MLRAQLVDAMVTWLENLKENSKQTLPTLNKGNNLFIQITNFQNEKGVNYSMY